MFLAKEDLKTVTPNEITTAITDHDDAIVETILLEAEETVRAYLHHRYDTAVIFTAEAGDRHPLIVRLAKEIAIYHPHPTLP